MKHSPALLSFLLGSSLFATPALAQTVTLNASDPTGNTSYNTGLNWSDGLAPSAGKDYAVSSATLRAPVTTAANQNFNFAGKSLTLNTSGILAWVGSTSNPNGTLTVNDLVLNGGQISVFRGNATLTMNGNISVTSNSTLAVGSTADTGTQVRNIILDSTLSGTSQLRMNASNNNPSLLTINGNNSGFSGGFLLTGTSGSVSSTLNVGHVNALGTGTITVNQGILNLNGLNVIIGGLAGANAAGNSVQNNSNTSATLTVDSTGNTTYAGVIQNGTGTGVLGLAKSGTGTLILSGANTYSGATTISAGTLEIQGSIANTASITNNSSLVFNSAADQSYGNAIGGSGTLAKQGAGTLTLSVNNSYTGTTTISEGVLQIGNGGTTGTLGNHSHTSIATGAELRIERSTDSFGYAYTGELSGNGTVNIPASRRFNFQTNNQTASGNLAFVVNGILGINSGTGVTSVHLGELGGSGTIQRAGTAPANPVPVVLTIGGKNTNSTYNGNITNIAEFALDKVGSGSLALEGSYGHGGGTTVTAGTLLINGSLTSSASAVTVGTNGTLGGTGTIAGTTTIEGSLNPGTSAGVLSFGSHLSLASDATTTMEILGLNRGTDYDGINVGGTLGLDGGLILDLGSVFGVGTHVFNLFAVTGSTSGDFDSVAIQGAYGSHSLAFSGGVWSTDTNSGNETWSFSQGTGDLTLTVIPEPRAALLGGLGLLLLLRRRRG